MPPRRKSSPVAAALANAALALLVVAGFLGGRRLIDGMAAREWARYYAELGVRPGHSTEEARRAGVNAARAVERVAPLPFAAEATEAVLALGRELQRSDPRATLAACGPTLQAVERAEATGWRGFGLHAAADELRALEATARAAGSTPQ
jgi:hypothetical protein